MCILVYKHRDLIKSLVVLYESGRTLQSFFGISYLLRFLIGGYFSEGSWVV